MLSKARKDSKKAAFGKERICNAIIGKFGFSGCEFRLYCPSTNNQIYSSKVRARSFQLVFCEPKYDIGIK